MSTGINRKAFANWRLSRRVLILAVGLTYPFASAPGAETLRPAEAKIDFNRDIRPILANNCFHCHGPDAQTREAGLRLDSLAGATAKLRKGRVALVPGDSSHSALIQRVSSENVDERMPPPDAHKRLAPPQIGMLRQWIDEGARYQEHWAFVPPRRPPIPSVKQSSWPRVPLDFFILARLEQEGLSPSAEADPYTLIRRVALDLTGLPPSPREVEEFVRDEDPKAYERLVDRLLASPHYGERGARRWLDLARYADTQGYEKDRERSIWPFRDWVIRALNRDLPFDQFTVEQIAGDLLPNAREDQIIATGFHRNTMVNEEGGIDTGEDRYKRMIDRVNTTGAVWLGLTMGCAQCHAHKFDPISQQEYFGLFALLNNADEPEWEVADPGIAQRRAALLSRISALEQARASHFPVEPSAVEWQALAATEVSSQGGATLTSLADQSILVSGANPETDVYTVVLETKLTNLTAIRLETLTDPSLPKTGPGRTPHGNFVLGELAVSAATLTNAAGVKPLKLTAAAADFSQQDFPVRQAIDGKLETGWAIDDFSGALNKNRTATFALAEPLDSKAGTRLVFTLSQNHGSHHTLGRFRLSVGVPRAVLAGGASEEVRRARHLEKKLTQWEEENRLKAVRWKPLHPQSAVSEQEATMVINEDGSVLASGFKPNTDTYELVLPTVLQNVTGLRLEVLTDPSLPDQGPGRADFFARGDFLLSEITVEAGPSGRTNLFQRVKLVHPTADYEGSGRPISEAIDGNATSGWMIKGQEGRDHRAVFPFEQPVASGTGTVLRVRLEQFFVHQATLGKFRISITAQSGPIQAARVPAPLEEILLLPRLERSPEQERALKEHFLAVAPELDSYNKEIAALRQTLPAYVTTMVMRERLPEHARPAYRRHRGEYTQPRELVEPGFPNVLHPPAKGTVPNRLALAQWLVDDRNPLVGRVVMNREWQAFFGRGIVATLEDFGTRGEKPTHPELLDWLATEFTQSGWRMKTIHKLLVMSAAYRQSSRVSPALLERDPDNLLCGRGPRFRCDAEVVRDLALSASGLLTLKVGGPSVRPPQPSEVTSQVYGGGGYSPSTGADRYRRGIYTHLKRGAPFAASITFDAPSADLACLRRARSNTPLQALTLLNDEVFVEAAQAFAQRVLRQGGRTLPERIRFLYLCALSRPPTPAESARIAEFYEQQLARFQSGQTEARSVARGVRPAAANEADIPELAAWTLICRAILNLDETITKG